MKTNLLLAGLLAVSTSPLFCAAADAAQADKPRPAIYYSYNPRTKEVVVHSVKPKAKERKERRNSKDTFSKAAAIYQAAKINAKKTAKFFNTQLQKNLILCTIDKPTEATLSWGGKNKQEQIVKYMKDFVAKTFIDLGEEKYFFFVDIDGEKDQVVITPKLQIEKPGTVSDQTIMVTLPTADGSPLQIIVPITR